VSYVPKEFFIERIASRTFKSRIATLPDDLLNMKECDLRREIRPTNLDQVLRYKFWHLISRGETEIKDTAIYGDLCSYANWYSRVLGNAKVLAWFLFPVERGSLSFRIIGPIE
jgi:hypothetical protein